MQVSCPHCTQRLRYPDHLSNPLLRCRNCGTTFRPADFRGFEQPVEAEAVEEYSPSQLPDEQLGDLLTEDSSRPERKSTVATQAAKSGAGYLAILLFIVAFKVGPPLVREFFREPKPEPPVQFQQDDEQALQKMLQEAAENAEKAGAPRNIPRRPIPDPPPLPNVP